MEAATALDLQRVLVDGAEVQRVNLVADIVPFRLEGHGGDLEGSNG